MRRTLVFSALVLCFFPPGSVQTEVRFNRSYLTEIVTGKEKGRELEVEERFGENQRIELDSQEPFYLEIRRTDAQDPFQPVDFGALVKTIEITTEFGDSVYPAIIRTDLDCTQAPSRYPITNCLDVVPPEVKGKINTRNVSDLSITVRVIWRSKNEVAVPCQQYYPTDPSEERIDVFKIDVKHFGFLLLVDLTPIAQSSVGQVQDVLVGILANLSYTSFDYAVISRDNNFKTAMISMPVCKVEGRSWWMQNVELQALLVKDLQNSGSYMGYGGGMGLLGDTKILKFGVFWTGNDHPRYYIGISLAGFAQWIANE